MAIQQTNIATRASIFTEIVQNEDDGSIAGATWTGLSAGVAGIVQVNGSIGDGPFGSTTGDVDGFRVELANGWTLRVNVDSVAFGTHGGNGFDPILKMYNSAGTLVPLGGSADDDQGSQDGYFTFTNSTGSAQTYTIFISDFQHQLSSPTDSGSAGVGGISQEQDTGPYRLFINTFDPANAAHGQIINGTLGADSLNGGNGNDVIELKEGDDTSIGGLGNDLFHWDMANGNDTIEGGTGSSPDSEINVLDVLGNQYDQTFSIVKGGFAAGGASFFRGFVLTASDQFGSRHVTANYLIQTIDIHGGDGNDTLTFTNIGNDPTGITFYGDGGNNVVTAAAAALPFRIFGGDGNDTLTTGSGADMFYGSLGNDYMDGGAGSDYANYSAFNRDLSIDLGVTTQQDTKAAGLDTLINIENVIGGSGFDVLKGNGLANTLIGGAGDDQLYGGTGAANTLQGGAGNDTYYSEASGDTVVEFANEGIDTVVTSLTAFALGANVENLTHTGSASFTGQGNGGSNTIIGGLGDDYLVGYAGNDVLIDGNGLNTLQGGQGDDIYAVQSNADTVFEFANEGNDEVQTFLPSYTLSNNVEYLTFIGAFAHAGTGNALDNRLIGTSGDETWTGLGGHDTYNYRAASNGHDIINDFDANNASASHDILDFAGRGLNMGMITQTSVSGGIMIGIPGGDTVFLKNVVSGSLDAGDFLF